MQVPVANAVGADAMFCCQYIGISLSVDAFVANAFWWWYLARLTLSVGGSWPDYAGDGSPEFRVWTKSYMPPTEHHCSQEMGSLQPQIAGFFGRLNEQALEQVTKKNDTTAGGCIGSELRAEFWFYSDLLLTLHPAQRTVLRNVAFPVQPHRAVS